MLSRYHTPKDVKSLISHTCTNFWVKNMVFEWKKGKTEKHTTLVIEFLSIWISPTGYIFHIPHFACLRHVT